MTVTSAPKRVVVWGTGFVGKLVIAEIVPHPAFELVGVDGAELGAGLGGDAGWQGEIGETGAEAEKARGRGGH